MRLSVCLDVNQRTQIVTATHKDL